MVLHSGKDLLLSHQMQYNSKRIFNQAVSYISDASATSDIPDVAQCEKLCLKVAKIIKVSILTTFEHISAPLFSGIVGIFDKNELLDHHHSETIVKLLAFLPHLHSLQFLNLIKHF